MRSIRSYIHSMSVFLFIFFLCCTTKIDAALKCADTATTEHSLTCNVSQICFRKASESGCVISNLCPKQSEECRDAKMAEMCCCSTDECNVVEKEKPNEQSSNALMIGLGVGLSFLFIIVVLVIAYCIYKKKAKKQSYEPMATESRASSSSEPSSTDRESSKEPQSVQFKDEQAMANSMIEEETRTDQLVLSITSKKDKQEIISSLNGEQFFVEGVDTMEAAPRITKVVSYGTTNDITMKEEMIHDNSSYGVDAEGVCCHLLSQLLDHGPRQFSFDLARLKKVLEAAADVVKDEDTLLEIPVPCIVYGDIHGQYSDLLRWFNLNGWPHKTRCLFLGDFVDRGSHGVEVIALMSCLKVLYPQNIFICRGNHEEENLNKAYSFFDEVKERFEGVPDNDKMYDHFKRLFNHLPLAALIGGRILGMHGGLSPQLKKLSDITRISRPIEEFVNGTLACDLVWSDPDLSGPKGQYRPNFDREPKLGIGQLFSAAAVEQACQRLGIDLVIRGHQAPLHGYARWAGGRLITLFSAPGYKGKSTGTVNMGACIEVAKDGQIVIKQIKVTEEFRQHRIEDVEKREKAHLERMARRNYTV